MAEHASIGQRLRASREEQGITPEQAAYRSKVPLQLLRALETDDYRLLPDPAYLIRPLHEYARVLGLDPVGLGEEFRQAIRRPPSPSLAVIPPPESPTPIPRTQVLWTLVAIVVVLPLVFIALSLVSKRVGEAPVVPGPAAPPVEQPVSPAGGGEAPPAFPGAGAGGAAAGAGEATPATGPGAAPARSGAPEGTAERGARRLLLEATAVEPTWMRVQADGGEQREVLLQKGQTVRFGAEKGFVVTVGNAGGIQLALNGAPLPSLGATGQVIRDLIIPLAEAAPSPGHPAGAPAAR